MSLLRSILLLLTATILVSASAVPTPEMTKTTTPVYDDDVPDGEESDDVMIEGIPLNALSPEEVDIFLEDVDAEFVADLDITVLKQEFAAQEVEDVAQVGVRKKRWIPFAARVLFTAGRALFRGASRFARPTSTRGGRIITQQYSKSGSRYDAVRDFYRFKPTNVQKYNNVRVGRIGNHQIKVRKDSRGPRNYSVEIITPRTGYTYKRKFRYGPGF